MKRNRFPGITRGLSGASAGRKSADHRTTGNRVGPASSRRGAGGDLANWKPGTLGSARRGVGHVDAGPPLPRSARGGRTRAAAVAPPMARRRASLAAQGCEFRGSPRRCSRKRPPHWVGAVPQERVQSTEYTAPSSVDDHRASQALFDDPRVSLRRLVHAW